MCCLDSFIDPFYNISNCFFFFYLSPPFKKKNLKGGPPSKIMDNKTVNITVLCSYKFAIKSVESLTNKHRIKSKSSREKGFWLLKTAKRKVKSRQRCLKNNERLIAVWLFCCLKNSFVCWVPEKLKLNAKSKNLKTPNGAMTYTMKEKKSFQKNTT